ncbi:hypothetical protein [Streptomyces parvus]|uniref:hypothetical protein n=1 Tax=Streptomyces parvus TaxID=66428 RepID=UPI0021008C35|nr:hypothetical protein [Streptomyces parvus]MCQ1581814.1 hypothetical protein [Streptomyces parvus]
MTDWSLLHHAYGTAEDIPGLLEAVGPNPRDPGWDALASRLYHQGGVYSASYAALTELAEKAGQWSLADRRMPLYLASQIVASRDIRDDLTDPFTTHTSEIAELLALTEEAFGDPALAGDSLNYVQLLSTLLSFEGVEGWGVHLDEVNGDEYEVSCPACSSENFVVFGELGHFSTADDMYFKRPPTDAIPLQPQDPATATGLLPRLHARALADGHPTVAGKLPYVFGYADCVHCGEHFSVPEAILARW